MELAFTPKERSVRYRERKRSALLCVEGGCWEPSGEFERCDGCAATHAAREKRRYEQRRAVEEQADDTEAA